MSLKYQAKILALLNNENEDKIIQEISAAVDAVEADIFARLPNAPEDDQS